MENLGGCGVGGFSEGRRRRLILWLWFGGGMIRLCPLLLDIYHIISAFTRTGRQKKKLKKLKTRARAHVPVEPTQSLVSNVKFISH